MKLFSIIQTSIDLRFSEDPEAAVQTITFTEDPNDSSNVRMRITPPNDGHDNDAVEIVFDRNGRERERRLWPMRYLSWDQRDPDTIEAEIAKRDADALDAREDAKAAEAVAPAAKKGRVGKG